MSREFLIIFPTTHRTLDAEESIQAAELAYRLVAKPREISSECGLGIRIGEEVFDEIVAVLRERELGTFKIYIRSRNLWRLLHEVPAENASG